MVFKDVSYIISWETHGYIYEMLWRGVVFCVCILDAVFVNERHCSVLLLAVGSWCCLPDFVYYAIYVLKIAVRVVYLPAGVGPASICIHMMIRHEYASPVQVTVTACSQHNAATGSACI